MILSDDSIVLLGQLYIITAINRPT